MGTGLFLPALLSLAVVAVWSATMLGALSVLKVPRKHWEALIVLPPLMLGVVITAYSVVSDDWSGSVIIATLLWAGVYLAAKRLHLWI